MELGLVWQRIKMTTKTLHGRFPTQHIGKVTFVFDLCFLCHSFHYVCQVLPLHGQLLVPDVFFRAVNQLQIKFVDSLWSVAELLFEHNIRISFITVSSKYLLVVLVSCFWVNRFPGSRFC